jgi:hypothetical protein
VLALLRLQPKPNDIVQLIERPLAAAWPPSPLATGARPEARARNVHHHIVIDIVVDRNRQKAARDADNKLRDPGELYRGRAKAEVHAIKVMINDLIDRKVVHGDHCEAWLAGRYPPIGREEVIKPEEKLRARAT